MKKMLVMMLVVIMLFTVCFIATGCGSTSTATEVEAISGSGSPTMDRILEEGVLKVGVALGGVPIAFVNDEGEEMGYDIDWAKKMAEVLGVELELVDVNGETRIPAVTSGRVDVIFANITGNLERAKTIDFSIPYLKAGIKVLTKTGSPYETIEDLNTPDAKVVVGRGTTGEALVLQYAPEATIVFVEGFPEQMLSVKQGKADAMIEDSTLLDYTASHSDGELVSHEKRYTSDPICIGVAKGDLEFVRWVDMFVSWQITQGFQEECYEKWWGVAPGKLNTLW